MSEKWTVITKGGDYGELGRRFGVSPVVARLMRNRGIETPEEARIFLGEPERGLNDGSLLADCDILTDILCSKISAGKHIRIIGDYDVDGVCSTCILQTVLNALGAKADHVIPDRIRDGYGLNMRLIEEAKADGVDTIITVDNGINAFDEIGRAKSLGMSVLVTDHHAVNFETLEGKRTEHLPEADAVVNPHRNGCKYPYKNLCGAAVAYRVSQVLMKKMGVSEDESWSLPEMAALATVCDVMPLTGENRSIVRIGLEKMSHTSNPGLRALIDLNSLDGKKINTTHAGFIIGPTINAAGRLKKAELALELLMSTNSAEAMKRAEELKKLNDSRKGMTNSAFSEACKLIENEDYVNDRILVVYLKDCHESLAGIVAGKLREKYLRPSLVLTDAVTDEGKPCLKGSGRSVEAYNMFEGIDSLKDILLHYGGHSQAAGFSLGKEHLREFRERLNSECLLKEEDLVSKVRIDMVLEFRHLSTKLVEELELMEPVGTENDPPLFAARNVRLSEGRVLGENRNVYTAMADDTTGRIKLKYFGDAEEFQNYVNQKNGILNICYTPEINVFRGEESLEIRVRHYL
ncbi:MAG: single-stranded-DNA-specific exonuclease RecJ [Lachnospiraceae bacterium]|nr:single-stranded-DNA-specific exonuclease RecJ [Lachnospiraceae bacterium]